ncbi:hypothetical protein BGZ63DRAFT_120145 [Mariannaea sp. PMI_226]|nr:hypothetical protein BGZ63DRAFT_120145 [Mariannaea sp. PMI_226]
MDPEEFQQRCSNRHSHYGLHRTHGNSRLPAYVRHPVQTRRPLRSITGNAALLRSPGPLQSMLKTTTETGDIGLFSIRPTLPSITYHHPPRPRLSFGDVGLLPRPHSRGVDESCTHDDRKALPSCRDTTSEIISLYGSSTQPSFPRSFSPSIDDGHRSYSLTTTCSPRHFPSQKSLYTSHSVSSNGGLHRSRSPFSYPTRLRRPGARPASPAATDNGNLEYCRIIELDKPTPAVHGSCKPAYYTGPRRPRPLTSRPEFNRSTSSLPSRVSPAPYHYGLGFNRSRTPNSAFRSSHRSPRVYQDSSDQSVRSASLTSIVEMYQRQLHPSRAMPILRSAGAFYYDYSEDFEPGPEQDYGYIVPLYPAPQRTKSIGRPMLRQEGSQLPLDVQDTLSEGQMVKEDKDGRQGKNLRVRRA